MSLWPGGVPSRKLTLQFGKAKNVPNWAQFQMTILITNISGTDKDIDKRKTALSTTIPLTFGKENLVNFGPLTTELTRLKFTHAK